MRAGAVGAAAEGEVGPFLDGEDAGGVGPVLEGVRVASSRRLSTVLRPTAPRRAYGISSWERARTEMVSSWTAPEVTEDAADAGPAVGGAEEALGAQRDAAGLVGGEVGGGARGRHASAR